MATIFGIIVVGIPLVLIASKCEFLWEALDALGNLIFPEE